jgi:integrase/recombinase XerD
LTHSVTSDSLPSSFFTFMIRLVKPVRYVIFWLRTGTLTATAMNRVDAWRMIQRRAAELGTRARIGCHTFRATGITAYLEAGGTLENAQAMAAHESPRTTKLYDRTGDEITLDEVERITI